IGRQRERSAPPAAGTRRRAVDRRRRALPHPRRRLSHAHRSPGDRRRANPAGGVGMTVTIPSRPAGSYPADTATLIGRSIRLTRRDADTLLMSIVLPVMLMLLFVFVFGGAIDTGTEYVTYVVPGIILLCVGYGASTTAMSVARDMHEGMIDRLQTLPIRSSSVLTGHVVASVARNAVAAVVVFAAAFVCGFR